MKLKYSTSITPADGQYLKLNGLFDKETKTFKPEG